MPGITEITSRLTQFVAETSYEDFPPETIKLAKELILHCLGGALGGTKEPSSQIIIDFVKEIGGTPEAGVMGTGFKSSVINAAFVGGFTTHAIEVEDGSWPGASSPITVVPVVFALAEKIGVTGKDIIESFVIGFEVQGKLAAAASSSASDRGVSTLTTIGALGAAAGAARMLKLDISTIKNALGIAASQAAGLTDCSVGNMTHYFQSGASCRNGLTAAQLAKAGFNANTHCLEMKNGLLDVLCGENAYNLGDITEGLGAPFHIQQVRVKKYPSCTLNHRIIDGVLALVREHDISYEQVDCVEVEANSALPRILIYPEPMDAEEAQFSLQYNVAAAILERKLDLEEFTEEKVSDPKRREFMRKVRLIVHPEWESVGLMGGTNPIVIKLKDGKQFSRDCVYAIGGPEERLPTAELSALFRPMARRVLSEKDVVRVEELVLDLENIGDLTELTGLLLG